MLHFWVFAESQQSAEYGVITVQRTVHSYLHTTEQILSAPRPSVCSCYGHVFGCVCSGISSRYCCKCRRMQLINRNGWILRFLPPPRPFSTWNYTVRRQFAGIFNWSVHTITMNDSAVPKVNVHGHPCLLSKALKLPYLSAEWIGRQRDKSPHPEIPLSRAGARCPGDGHCATTVDAGIRWRRRIRCRCGLARRGSTRFYLSVEPEALPSAWATTPRAEEASRASISPGTACRQLRTASGRSETAGPDKKLVSVLADRWLATAGSKLSCRGKRLCPPTNDHWSVINIYRCTTDVHTSIPPKRS